ncbi:MAG: ABC transporter permease, partial [Dermatophilaceae bacterium]
MADKFTAKRREPLLRRLPVISHFRKSVGLQRGMLVTGIILTVFFLATAALAPVLAPYGFAERFDTQQPPSSA